MPHLLRKEIPIYAETPDGEPKARVGDALVVHHDEEAVEFFVRLTDPSMVKTLRKSPVTGLHFLISRPVPVETVPAIYPIEVVGHDSDPSHILPK